MIDSAEQRRHAAPPSQESGDGYPTTASLNAGFAADATRSIAAAARKAIETQMVEYRPRLKAIVNQAYVTPNGFVTGSHGIPGGAVPFRTFIARKRLRRGLPTRRPASRSVRRTSRRVRSAATSRDGPGRQDDQPHIDAGLRPSVVVAA